MVWNVRREKRLRIKKSVKTREGREIVPPPFSYILLPSSTQSEINKFIPFEFGESREKEFVSRTGENFWESRKFLSAITFFRDSELGNFAAEFYADTMKKVKQYRGRGVQFLSSRKKIHWSFFTKVHLRPRPLVRATLALKVFIKYIRGYHNKPKESVYARGD